MDFVVIGGLAVILSGGDQSTRDIDVAFRRHRQNALCIANALAPFHPRPAEWPEGVPFVWDEHMVMNMTVLTLETDLGRIDLLAAPEGAPPFESLRREAHEFELDGETIAVASIEHLISMKKAAGRPRDLAHIAQLETLQRLSGGRAPSD